MRRLAVCGIAAPLVLGAAHAVAGWAALLAAFLIIWLATVLAYPPRPLSMGELHRGIGGRP